MGCFESKCPKCEKSHYWFFKAEDTLCKQCGYLITSEEMSDSWDQIYTDYLKEIEIIKESKNGKSTNT